MPENTNVSATPNHKPKLLWSLPAAAFPTPDQLRRIPELDAIEHNPWYRLFMAGRARHLARFSRTNSFLIASFVHIFVSLFLTAYALLALPVFIGTSSINSSDWPTLFLGVVSYRTSLIFLNECWGYWANGFIHPLAIAFSRSRDTMRDLAAAQSEPRSIAQAWFAALCVPNPRARWTFLLVWLTPVSLAFAALCTWRFRGETAAQLAILPPMILAGYGWGLLPRAEHVLLNHAARLRPRAAQVSAHPMASLMYNSRKLFGIMLGVVWKSVAILSLSYVFLFLVEESELLPPDAEVLPGLVAWPLYAYWLMLAAFIYGLIQTIYSSKLASSNLDRLATNSPIIMQMLFPDEIEPDPPAPKPSRRTLRRTPREFLRWLFRTPVPLSAFGTFTRAVRVSIRSICLLFTAILLSPPGSILAWFDRSDANYVWDTWKRGYSFSDIQKRYKWQHPDVTVALHGNAQTTRRISVTQSGSDFGWIDDFQHLLTSQTKLDLVLTAPPPSSEALAKLLSNPGIRRSLTEFRYGGYLDSSSVPLKFESEHDFSKMEQLKKFNVHPIDITDILRMPSSLRNLELSSWRGVNRIWINPTDSKLRRITFNSSEQYVDLKSFLSQISIETAHVSLIVPPDCSDLGELKELLRCRSLSLYYITGGQGLKGIDSISDLEVLDIMVRAASDLPALEGVLPWLLKCTNLKALSVNSLGDFSPVSSAMMPTLIQLEKLERLEIGFFSSQFGNIDGRVLDKPSSSYPKPQPFLYSEYRRPRISTEAAYIEAQVRWPEALEKVVQKIDAAIEAERKLAETPVTDETAAQILWPNSSP